MSDSHEPELPLHSEEGTDTGEVKPFLEHLEDLRWMLIKMVSVLAAGMILSFTFARELLAMIIWPLARVVGNPKPYLRTLEVTGGFALAMKLALYAGLILTMPLLLYFLADFILPALTRREKGLLNPAFTVGAALFLAGAALAYFVVVPAGLKFFLYFNDNLGISSEWTIDNYVSFVSHMLLAFGLCFELPLVVLLLAKLGVVSAGFLRAKRAHVVVIILIIAAVVTPTTDPINMMMLAGPMMVLYEACIWIAWWMERRATRTSSGT